MARLALDQAPAVTLPRRFLFSMPVWGVLAGILLLVDGESLLHSRWYPGTLALVHIATLGILANAMFGSLLQFLPAAAGVRLRGGALGAWMHAALNAGTLSLVMGFYCGSTALLMLAAMLLPLAFLVLFGMTLPGVCAAVGQRLLRAGIGASLVFGMVTALLGGALAVCFTGALSMVVPPWVDVHGSLGVLGWVLLLLVSVGRVVVPMFQGTDTPPPKWHAAWLIGLIVLLSTAAAWRVTALESVGLMACWMFFSASSALTVMWLQRRTSKARRGPLWWSWRLGMWVLLASAATVPWMSRAPLLPGALALAFALPLLVAGMALEIVAFLGWIELHRRVGRGVQLPGVQRLMPAHERVMAVAALTVAGGAVAASFAHPAMWLARAAGLSQCVAWGAVAAAFLSTRHRVQRFLRDHEYERRNLCQRV